MKRAAESHGRTKVKRKRRILSAVIDGDALLQLVKGCELLYDRNHPSWVDHNLKRSAWKEIAGELGCSVEMVQAKWKNFKDNYLRYLKYVAESKMARKSYKVWSYAEAMKFLRPYISKDSVDNYSTDDELACHDMSSYLKAKQPKIDPDLVKKQQSPPNIDNDDYEVFEIVDSDNDLDEDEIDESQYCEQSATTVPVKVKDARSDIVCTTKPLELDADDLFFLHYSKIIKKFAPSKRSLAKFKIAEIVMKMETDTNT